MIVSALRTDYETKVRDANNRILTDAEYLVLLNGAIREWQNRTEELRRENAFTVTARQFDYAAPSDILKLVTAIWMPTGSELEVVAPTELMRLGGYRLRVVGTPALISQDENNGRIRLYPAPPASSAATAINQGAGIDASVTTIPVDSTTTFSEPGGWALIQSEKVLYQSLDSTNLLLCRRAMGGTTAATHADDIAVTQCDLHLIYSYVPAALTADGDSPPFNSRWHEYLNWFVLATALKLDGRMQDAMAAEAKWEASIRQAIRSVKRVQSASPFGSLGTGY